MTIKRGVPTHRRKNARNFIQKQAQNRLVETVAAANQQYVNSLFVNGVDIDLYQICHSDRPCTCEKTEILSEFATKGGDPQLPTNENEDSAEYEFQNNIFGEQHEQTYNDEVLDIMDRAAQRQETGLSGAELGGSTEYKEGPTAGSNSKCGICYKTGMQPGYVAYGKQRQLFTTLDILDLDGYYINRTLAPHTLEKQHEQAYITFKTVIPKYFKTCGISIRDNCTEIQGATLYVNELPLTRAVLDTYRGQELVFQVKEQQFTHCVIEFDMGIEKPKIDLSAEILTLDYNRIVPLGSFSIVISPNVLTLNNSDIVIIRTRSMGLKLNEVRPRQTSERLIMGWDCQARILQPNEDVRRIHATQLLR